MPPDAMPPWALALAYMFHLVATVVWVGGLVVLALVVEPGARARLGPGPALGQLLGDLQRRFNPLAWTSLAVLTGTGLMQMAADPNYEGFLVIDNAWSVAILVKHVAVFGMVAAGAAGQWLIQPALARLNVLEARGRPAPEAAALRRRAAWLSRLNLACALATLVCTAVATAQ